jgi:hypothetical protein
MFTYLHAIRRFGNSQPFRIEIKVAGDTPTQVGGSHLDLVLVLFGHRRRVIAIV